MNKGTRQILYLALLAAAAWYGWKMYQGSKDRAA